MNASFDKKSDIYFEQAVEMSDKDFLHSELVSMLKEGNIAQKQIAALKLDSLQNKEEGRILIDNLTGCDGKIREAVALKINQLLTTDPKYVDFLQYPEVFAAATIDINANICRLVIDSIYIMQSGDENFSNVYLKKIFGFIEEAFNELDKFIFKDKKYVINKQLFKLYWCLEGLKPFTEKIDFEILYKILEKSCEIKEYTIREKAAQIIVLVNSSVFTPLREKLINDENYYVREVFKK